MMMNEQRKLVYIFCFSFYAILVIYHSGSEVIGSAIIAKYVVSTPSILPVLYYFMLNSVFFLMCVKQIQLSINTNFRWNNLKSCSWLVPLDKINTSNSNQFKAGFYRHIYSLLLRCCACFVPIEVSPWVVYNQCPHIG